MQWWGNVFPGQILPFKAEEERKELFPASLYLQQLIFRYLSPPCPSLPQTEMTQMNFAQFHSVSLLLSAPSYGNFHPGSKAPLSKQGTHV